MTYLEFLFEQQTIWEKYIFQEFYSNLQHPRFKYDRCPTFNKGQSMQHSPDSANDGVKR